MRKNKNNSLVYFIALIFIVGGAYFKDELGNFPSSKEINVYTHVSNVEEIPEYSGENYAIINNNNPDFDEKYYLEDSFEIYNALDSLGRCTQAFANVSLETMPDEERDSIGQVKPTGWHTVKYDIVDGKYLYNRCHLIGYQLTGENANEKNLITCTRQMNVSGMLEFENQVSEYVKETDNHVLYRVTPIYEEDNLLAKGVQIEAYSIEDNGAGIRFNVFVYNVQDGIDIDYKTGKSKLRESNNY